MVRKVDIQCQLSKCTAASIWDGLYSLPNSTMAYHARVNKDPKAQVGEWQHGVRKVHFCMNLSAPDWVKKTVGISDVRVCETQSVVWQGAGCFSVCSETAMLNVPGASRFTTSLLLSVTERQIGVDGSISDAATSGSETVCDLLYTVRCSAGMPWPMNVSIENIMAEGAQGSMQGYLAYCHELMSARAVESLGAGHSPTATQPIGPGALASATPSGLEPTMDSARPCFLRWPSVAVSSYVQGLDEVQHLPGLTQGSPIGDETLGSGADEWVDAAESWRSPASSSFNGTAEPTGARGAPTTIMDSASVTTALHTLAAAIQALDHKVTLITQQLPTGPDPRAAPNSRKRDSRARAAAHDLESGHPLLHSDEREADQQEPSQPTTCFKATRRLVYLLLLVGALTGCAWLLWHFGVAHGLVPG